MNADFATPRAAAPIAIALAAALLLGGCVTHIAPYRAKHRNFDVGDYADLQKPTDGSLYSSTGRGLFEDDRARRVGDIVIIQIDENETASREGQTSLKSSNSNALGITGLVSLLTKAVPNLDLSKLFGSQTDFGFTGGGTIDKKGTLNATLPVRVRKVLPNDDLYVEGTKVVMVGNEEHHLYVSGIVRAVDIRTDGSVLSSRVADAEIEFTGRGDITDKSRPGWFSRILSKVWPF